MDKVSLLEKLTGTLGVSGFEDEICSLLKSHVEKLGFKTWTDRLGSLIAHKEGAGPRVMVVAHMDEIGFVVRYVDDKGYLYLTRVGGVNPRTLPGARVVVWSRGGPLEGVIGEKPIHRMKEDELKKAPELDKLFVDLGLSADQVKEKVRRGDPVSFKPNFTVLGGDKIASKSLDDRLGCLTLLLIAESVKSERLPVDLYLVFSAREEVGLEGARTAAFEINPEVAIAVDVTHAGDHPALDEKEAPVKLGEGPVISRGAAPDNKVTDALIEAAERSGVKYQLEAEGGRTGTDIDAVRLVRAGVRAGLVSLPLRYMHTPSEVGSINDAWNAAKLIAEFLAQWKL